MNNAEIFLEPGQIALNFLLSLFEYQIETLDPALQTILSGMIATVIWSWTLRIFFEITKRAFGFGNSRGHYR
ncbi:MAG: hypothetical protein JSS37_02460 [Proteobacteria bacterium]|nr:hypothetical protein [Pseudomonadota bacterium]